MEENTKRKPKDTTIDLYRAIREDFKEYSDKKEFGVTKYSNAWIMHKLASKYYKSPITIENIVFHRTAV